MHPEDPLRGASSGPSGESPSALPSLPARFGLALASPGRLFEGLRTDPRSAGAIVVGAVLVGAANAAIPADVWEQVIRDQTLAAGAELSPDLSGPATFARWAATVGAAVFWPVLTLLVAGIYSLLFLAGLGYRGRYPVYLAVSAHALLIGAMGAVAMTPIRIMTGDVQLMLTLGAFLPEAGSGLLAEGGLVARLVRYLDLFNLWATGLIGLGASIVDGQRSAAASVLYALGASLLIALLLATFLP